MSCAQNRETKWIQYIRMTLKIINNNGGHGLVVLGATSRCRQQIRPESRDLLSITATWKDDRPHERTRGKARHSHRQENKDAGRLFLRNCFRGYGAFTGNPVCNISSLTAASLFTRSVSRALCDAKQILLLLLSWSSHTTMDAMN